MQSKEIATKAPSEIAATINAKWREARELADKSEGAAVLSFNALREVGILLGPRWRDIQGELEFGEKSIQMCLTFARKHPEPVTCATRAIRMLDEIRMTTGLLPFSDGHGPQQLHQPNFFSVVSKQFTAFRGEWRRHIARSPIDKWDQPSLEQFVNQLEPAINEINGIYAAAKAKLFAGPS